MQPTLLLRRIFPPPAARAEILSGLYGAGAGCAAYADKALVVQGVVGDIVLPNVVVHLIKSPIEERVKFEKLVCGIPFKGFHVEAVGRLFAADAGDPELLPI